MDGRNSNQVRLHILVIVVAVMAVVSVVPSTSVGECPPGMSSYWRFDEGSGTTAGDYVGSNDGTIYGASWVDGRVGGGLYFDGAHDYIIVPDSPELNTPHISIEAWIMLTAQGPVGGAALVEKDGWHGGQTGYAFLIGNWGMENTLRFEVFGPWRVLDSVTGLSLNQWYSVVATFDGSLMRIYVNGELNSSRTVSEPINLGNDGVLGIGSRFTNNDVYGPELPTNTVSGTIDEVAIYSRALSLDEIQEHYQKGLLDLGYCDEIVVPAAVDIHPDVLNPRSGGRWVTCYIELPDGYDPTDIDVSTVTLNDTAHAEMEPTSVGDHDADGVPDRMVKFSRSEVIGILPHGECVEVRVSGEVQGRPFAGADSIRVLMPKVKYPNGGEVIEAGQVCTITWDDPDGYNPDWFKVYCTADGGDSWQVIDEEAHGTSLSWVVPDVPSTTCLVLVEAYDDEGIMGYDMSNDFFAIGNAAGVIPGSTPSTGFALYPIVPNPAGQGATIRFARPDSRRVSLTIHDVRGTLVRKLIDDPCPGISHSIWWDGTNDSAGEVPAGVYFVHLQAGQYSATRKMVVIR